MFPISMVSDRLLRAFTLNIKFKTVLFLTILTAWKESRILLIDLAGCLQLAIIYKFSECKWNE